jgi:hypothetical protein
MYSPKYIRQRTVRTWLDGLILNTPRTRAAIPMLIVFRRMAAPAP